MADLRPSPKLFQQEMALRKEITKRKLTLKESSGPLPPRPTGLYLPNTTAH